jgi:hypothetical protein
VLNLIWPKDLSEVWTAVGAVAALYLAWVANRLSKRQLQLESTPVLLVSRVDGHTVVANVGRGTAFMLVACDASGEILQERPSLQAGATINFDDVVPKISTVATGQTVEPRCVVAIVLRLAVVMALAASLDTWHEVESENSHRLRADVVLRFAPIANVSVLLIRPPNDRLRPLWIHQPYGI